MDNGNGFVSSDGECLYRIGYSYGRLHLLKEDPGVSCHLVTIPNLTISESRGKIGCPEREHGREIFVLICFGKFRILLFKGPPHRLRLILYDNFVAFYFDLKLFILRDL